MSDLQLPPLALYVHVPWCQRKCPYCDFNSHAVREPLPEAAYIDALLSDLEAELPFVQGRALHSVFIGGGTPSLLTGEAVARLLDGIRARIPLAAEAEVTLEASSWWRDEAFVDASGGDLSDHPAIGMTLEWSAP